MDTVDLSNLNRQFLFSREHIKQPKAVVAAETASKFNPNVKIVPHFSDIKNTTLFPLEWFRSFDIVYNALDNKDARIYVNRMCLVTNTPLIESGTAGYLGQTQVIVNGKTECYDCRPKPVPKTFAVCTIRSTPSQPIHSVVWAKSFLYAQLFDAPEDDDTSNGDGLVEESAEENSEESETLNKEANELKELQQGLLEKDFAKRVFDKVFSLDIERLVSIDSMWKMRKPPTPLYYDKLVDEITAGGSDVKTLAAESLALDQKDWTIAETFAVFSDAADRLQKRILEGSEAGIKAISFDKDDEDTLDFVVAAAQLRSYIFGIQTKSKFAFKQIAGNIIPAIATTNAIVAGLSVLQSIKIISALDYTKREQKSLDTLTPEVLSTVPTVFLSAEPSSVFSLERTTQPSPECVACGVSRSILSVDIKKTSLRDIVETLITENWKYSEEVSIVTSDLIYDPDFDDNLDRTLDDLGIKTSSFITVIDEADEHDDEDPTGPRANIELYFVEPETGDSLDPQELLASLPKITFKKKHIPAPEDDEVSAGGAKRKLEGNVHESVSKKIKTIQKSDGIIEIDLSDDEDDEDDDLIVIG